MGTARTVTRVIQLGKAEKAGGITVRARARTAEKLLNATNLNTNLGQAKLRRQQRQSSFICSVRSHLQL